MLSMLLQVPNALSPIVATFAGIYMLVRPDSSKDLMPMLVRVKGNVTFVRLS